MLVRVLLIVDDADLERLYLERWEDVPDGQGFTEPGRQILHCTFGAVVTHPRLGDSLFDLLRDRQDEFTAVLREHFVRHLQALNAS